MSRPLATLGSIDLYAFLYLEALPNFYDAVFETVISWNTRNSVFAEKARHNASVRQIVMIWPKSWLGLAQPIIKGL